MGSGKRQDFRTVLGLLSLVLLGALSLSLGVNSIINSKERCVTIAETFNQPELDRYYVKDTVERSTPAYYGWEYRISRVLKLFEKKYYLVKPKGEDKWITIMADNKWIEQFDAITGYAKNNIVVEGDFKKLGADDEERIQQIKEDMDIEGEVRTDYAISISTNNKNIYRIILGVICLILIVTELYEVRQRREISNGENTKISWGAKVINVVGIIILLLLLFKGNILF